MHAKTTLLVLLALVGSSLVAIPSAQAQNTTDQPGAWHGQDSEFGSIRAPYSSDMNGQRVPVEAHVVLRTNYDDRNAGFFMFAWTVENTPLDVSFDHLVRTDNNQELPCYQQQGDSHSQIKCFVDKQNMPAPGTEIVMTGTVGSSRTGQFQVGAIAMAFTYTWQTVQTSNGLDAQLYGYTLINVNKATSGAGRLGGLGNAVPDVGVAGAVGAVALASVATLALRRKEWP
jgi:hypothetical protein